MDWLKLTHVLFGCFDSGTLEISWTPVELSEQAIEMHIFIEKWMN